jgi:two-component system, chemotaxis family, chemotaxis protein CheY
MGKRILAADDSPSVRQVVNFVLTGAGYDVVEAVDGKDALSKLGSTPVSLIVTDLNMPNLDGVGLIKAVRSHPAHRLTPILMVTTESSSEKKQEGRSAGATGWVVKPFTPDQLVAVVRKLIG